MNIKPIVYESLTTKQRILAALEAQKRGDEDEIRRIINTIPEQAENGNMNAVIKNAAATLRDKLGE